MVVVSPRNQIDVNFDADVSESRVGIALHSKGTFHLGW